MSAQLVLASAFLAGLASSVGPCIAPRYLMLAAYVTDRREGARGLVFIAGCLGGYLAYGSAGALIALLRIGTHFIYASLAVALIVCGAHTLTFAHHRACESKRAPKLSLGAIFMAGLVSSVIFSPCCTPIAIALGLQAVQHGGAMAASLLLAFGIGHTLPLVGVALVTSVRMPVRLSLPHDACATVSGTLLLMVGGLYAILA